MSLETTITMGQYGKLWENDVFFFFIGNQRTKIKPYNHVDRMGYITNTMLFWGVSEIGYTPQWLFLF
jgi:hypothetical protein